MVTAAAACEQVGIHALWQCKEHFIHSHQICSCRSVFSASMRLPPPIRKAGRADNCVQDPALQLGQYWIMQAPQISPPQMEISSATALPSQPLFHLDGQKSLRCTHARTHKHAHKCTTHTHTHTHTHTSQKRKRAASKRQGLTEISRPWSFQWVLVT